MEVGIDKLGFYTPQYYMDMADLAEARHEAPGKFLKGLGQSKMAVAPITQDPVTLACNAANNILTDEDRAAIDYVIVGSESGVDQSKAMAVYVHDLLTINPFARAIEIKEACYGATAGLQAAVDHVTRHPERKALVIAADIARYGLASSGEATQGAGSVAMLITANPRIATVNYDSVYFSGDIMDFWRPNYSDTAKVVGKYSTEKYLEFLDQVWSKYKERTELTLDDFEAICFHLPYTKMGLKGLRQLLPEVSETKANELLEHFENSREYNRQVGNIYTGSLYLSLLSLLEQDETLTSGDRIGMFSYGSGAVGEFFSLTLQASYKEALLPEIHQKLLTNRQSLSLSAYEEMFQETLPTDGSSQYLSEEPNVVYQVGGIEEHKRLYQKNN